MSRLLIFILGIVVGGASLYVYGELRNRYAPKRAPYLSTAADADEGEVRGTGDRDPFPRYAFPALRQETFEASAITFGELDTRLFSPTPSPTPRPRSVPAVRATPAPDDTPKFIKKMFFITVDGRRVSGLATIPLLEQSGEVPVIILVRGFVDKSIYIPGVGSSRVGEALATNGYLTLAPDFFGYGESDPSSELSLEDRFQSYTTMLTLFASMSTLDDALAASDGPESELRVDENRIGIWAHSNGGQIALSSLAISGKEYPTVLWNPVTKPFPFSVLYFTDEFADNGRALRKVIADFELTHDIEEYTYTNYMEWIAAPLQLHQGAADDAVPQSWSDWFVRRMEEEGKAVEYHVYPDSDHNLNPGWDTAVRRTMDFYWNTFGESD